MALLAPVVRVVLVLLPRLALLVLPVARVVQREFYILEVWLVTIHWLLLIVTIRLVL
jgi:hypothetical protein